MLIFISRAINSKTPVGPAFVLNGELLHYDFGSV